MQKDTTQNNRLFIFGIICLMICLASILYSLYILPFLIWNLSYHVADTVLNLIAWFEDNFYYSPAVSRLLTWLIFFIPGVITGLLSWYVSINLDRQALGLEIEPTESEEQPAIKTQQFKRDMRESAGIGMKILFLMLCVLGLVAVVQLIL